MDKGNSHVIKWPAWVRIPQGLATQKALHLPIKGGRTDRRTGSMLRFSMLYMLCEEKTHLK